MEFRGNYAFLSNMYFSPITITMSKREGLVKEVFYSVENAFQYFKCIDPKICVQIAEASPKDAKKLGRRCPMRPDWNEKRLQVMRALIRAKFQQNPDLAEKLIAIKEPIVEDNTWNDTYWGVCNGKGSNHLGKILMTVRQELLDSNLNF